MENSNIIAENLNLILTGMGALLASIIPLVTMYLSKKNRATKPDEINTDKTELIMEKIIVVLNKVFYLKYVKLLNDQMSCARKFIKMFYSDTESNLKKYGKEKGIDKETINVIVNSLHSANSETLSELESMFVNNGYAKMDDVYWEKYLKNNTEAILSSHKNYMETKCEDLLPEDEFVYIYKDMFSKVQTIFNEARRVAISYNYEIQDMYDNFSKDYFEIFEKDYELKI